MKTRIKFISLASILLLVLTTCKKDPQPIMERFDLSREDLTIGTTSASIVGTYVYSGAIDEITVCVSEDGVHPATFAADINGKNFSVEMTGLRPATSYQYYYSVDYGFSKPFITETNSFTTLSESPTVKTLEVLAIDSTTYRVKCKVVSDGGQEVTERGICWANYSDPTVIDNVIKDSEAGTGEYYIRMEHLVLGEKYYVRAYAKNAANMTGFSEEVLDFETQAAAGQTVEIDLGCNPEQGGIVSGGGTYEVGTHCTVKAEANAGYTFVNWTENSDQVSSEAQYTFAVTTSRSLVAHFTKQAYVITTEVDPEDSGTVTGAGGYNYGDQCILTATPKAGYDFEKWTKGSTTVSTSAEYSFTVNASATYVAHFKVKSYMVTVSANPSNGGAVTGGGTYIYGQSCRVQATPADGYAFANWTDEGGVVTEEADYTFTVTSSRTLVANFTVLQPNEYTIQVSADPSNGGTVTGGGTYQEGQSCTVTANNNPGYSFVNWTENGNVVQGAGASYTFAVTSNRVLVAHFEAQAPTEYTVTVSANPSNGGAVTGGGTYQQGEQCNVTATAANGYTFVNWTENGNVVQGAGTSYTFIVNGDRNLVANFLLQQFTISVSANPSNGGTVTGGGTYNYGQSCTLTATAAAGYVFLRWTENGSQVSTNASYTFTVNSNRTLVANFLAAPTGAINGVFSVSSTQKIWFSQGNLQYRASTQTWRFAENQWNIVGSYANSPEPGGNVSGSDNSYISSTYSGWIDLFGWGTSGWNNGNTYYHPWDSESGEGSIGAAPLYGPLGSYNLTGSFAQSDWGVNNTITIGNTTSNQWRTLTKDEWWYVFNTRPGIRFAKACVNNVNGVVLLPDNWIASTYGLNNTNNGDVSYNSNVISASQWITLQNAGAVFLPAGGRRVGTLVVDINSGGFYWSTTSNGNEKADYVEIAGSHLGAYYMQYRNYGKSVRLVRLVQ